MGGIEKVGGGGRVCFRGDTRLPGEIFSHGFFSRDPQAPITYRPGKKVILPIRDEHKPLYENKGLTFREEEDGWNVMLPRAGDICQSTAVCVTSRFTMAPLFPTDPKIKEVWVYAVYVRELFNTHKLQYQDGMKSILAEMPVRRAIKAQGDEPQVKDENFEKIVENGALWPLYAQELATKAIPAQDVICALKVNRRFREEDFTSGVDYVLQKDTLTYNWGCEVDQSITNTAMEFFKNEPRSGTTPSRSSGFQKSTED